MADDKSVNPVMDCADLKTYYRKHDGTDDRGIRGLPRGPASGRYGTLPLSMLERVEATAQEIFQESIPEEAPAEVDSETAIITMPDGTKARVRI